jgi:hypothetical protein
LLLHLQANNFTHILNSFSIFSLSSSQASSKRHVRRLGVQERGCPPSRKPGRGIIGWKPAGRELPWPEGAGSHFQQRSCYVVLRARAEAAIAWVGEILRRPGPPPVPQTGHRPPHLPPQGFQQVQVHAHVRHRR